MPHADPEARREYQKKRYEEKRDQMRLANRKARQKRLAYYRKKSTERNRSKGHEERSKGRRAVPRISVPQQRRYVIIDDKAYFSVETGFTSEQLEEVLKELAGKPTAKAATAPATKRRKPAGQAKA